MKAIKFNQEQFIKDYQELKSARKMAERYHCGKSTILNYAHSINYDTSHNKPIKITNVPINIVIKDYEELGSCKEVGNKYNCSGQAVRNYLINNGYIFPTRSKTATFDPIQFGKDYDELQSADKMAELYNCSSTTILNYAHEIGYDVNNKNYKLSEQDKLDIKNAYLTHSSTELSKKYNVSRGMITKIWYDNGLIGKNILHPETTEVDITGQQFGLWTVLYKTDKRNPGGVIYWHCKCQCGIERDVLGTTLRRGDSLSCGAHKNISKGNEKIKQLLIDANIPFEMEKTFDTCKDKKCLPFDFYVDNTYLIEYDGIQHYQLDNLFDYEYTHAHDIIKTNWCKENNIPLIRIPYTHFNELCLNDLLLSSSNFIES